MRAVSRGFSSTFTFTPLATIQDTSGDTASTSYTQRRVADLLATQYCHCDHSNHFARESFVIIRVVGCHVMIDDLVALKEVGFQERYIHLWSSENLETRIL